MFEIGESHGKPLVGIKGSRKEDSLGSLRQNVLAQVLGRVGF